MLTIDMIDVVSAHVFVIGLLPAEWKLVTDAICEGLGFCESENKKETFLAMQIIYFTNGYRKSRCLEVYVFLNDS